MIAIRGADSAIARALTRILPTWECWSPILRGAVPPFDCERYFFAQGLIRSKPVIEQSLDEREESFDVNAHQVMAACDAVLAENPKARICVVGSESAFAGSFDGSYAWAKKKLHDYVEHKKLEHPGQQLVCIAPGIIGDAGMTLRRHDTERLDERRLAHPKRRWLKSAEIARLVHYLLYVDEGYLSSTVIRVNGGEHLWR